MLKQLISQRYIGGIYPQRGWELRPCFHSFWHGLHYYRAGSPPDRQRGRHKYCSTVGRGGTLGSEGPKAPLLGSPSEIQHSLRIDSANDFASEVSGEKPSSDLSCVGLWDAEDVPKARKTGEPEIER
jgi:hypothetical protein